MEHGGNGISEQLIQLAGQQPQLVVVAIVAITLVLLVVVSRFSRFSLKNGQREVELASTTEILPKWDLKADRDESDEDERAS